MSGSAIDRFTPCVQSSTVEIVRHTYDCYEVTAFGLHGQVLRRRAFTYGRKRKLWAMQQAEAWAEQFYLRFDRVIYC